MKEMADGFKNFTDVPDFLGDVLETGKLKFFARPNSLTYDKDAAHTRS